MKFLYPQFLYALFALVIPVIIHLFNFQRYKKVYFSNVSFLKEVKHSTQAKSNLKHILILISRMLAITAIVLAFAQPFIPVSDTEIKAQVSQSSVFIDNSFSSQNRSQDGIVFDLERQLGLELLAELPKTVNHQLLSNSFSGSEQHLFPTTELLKRAENLQISPKTQSLDKILKRQSTAFESESYSSFIISEFQKNQFDFTNVNPDSLATYTLIPVVPVKTNNVSIDSIWFTSPVHRINSEDEIHFRLTNHGLDDKSNVTVNLQIDTAQKGLVNVALPANSSFDTLIKFNSKSTGWHSGQISLDDFPIVFDNQFHFSYYIKEYVKVLEINSEATNSNIQRAFETEPYFHYSLIKDSQVDIDQLNNTDLLILNNLDNISSGLISSVVNFVDQGGNLVVIPSNTPEQQSVNNLLSKLKIGNLTSIQTDSIRISNIDLNSNLFQGVFTTSSDKVNLPNVYQYFNFNGNSNGLSLLTTPNNHPILSQWNEMKGNVYVFTVALSPTFSNFEQHSIFLPTFFQMGFNSGFQNNPYFIIGQDELIPMNSAVSGNELVFHLKNKELEVDHIPEVIPSKANVTLALHEGIQNSGTYQFTQKDSVIGLLSFNHLRTESKADFYSPNDLNQIIDSLGLLNFSVFETGTESLSSDFQKRDKGIELWKWFIVLTLLFLAIEIVLIRFFKPAVL